MGARYPFALERPSSVEAAVAVVAEASGNVRVMAGGQSLTPLLTLGLSSPDVVVSLDRCDDLKTVAATTSHVRIGAMVTTAKVVESNDVAQAFPLVNTAAARVGSPHVRNFGTAVGNVCHADPGSDLIPALLCHRVEVELRSPSGTRSVEVDDFVTGAFSTTIADAEVATGLTISREDPAGWCHGYRKLVKRSGDLAMATCAVRLRLEAGAIETARVAIGGALSRARRLRAVEAALITTPVGEAAERALLADWRTDAVDYLLEDAHAPLDYLELMFPRFIAATIADAVNGHTP